MRLRSKIAASVLGVAALAAGTVAVTNSTDVNVPGIAAVTDNADSNTRGGGGFFYSRCELDRAIPDDPIVFPAQPGASHLHEFFGATSVDAFSQPENLVDGPSTCRDRQGATYWVPALYLDGQRIAPDYVNVRYGLSRRNTDTLQAFPPGLAMVAGRTAKTVEWNCKPTPKPLIKKANRQQVPDCNQLRPGSTLTVNITMPDCWNGKDLDSPDHISHMLYSSYARPKPKGGGCPEGWVSVPSLQIKVHYPKLTDRQSTAAATAYLASGIPATMHADFLNTWNQDRLDELVDYCLRGRRNCGEAATPPP